MSGLIFGKPFSSLICLSVFIYQKYLVTKKAGGQSYRPNDSITFAGVMNHYQGKDRPRLIVLSDCARPCSYERNLATFGCKGTTIFPHTQINRQKYCRFSICGVFFSFLYNYTPATFHALKTHANHLHDIVRSCTQSSQQLCS